MALENILRRDAERIREMEVHQQRLVDTTLVGNDYHSVDLVTVGVKKIKVIDKGDINRCYAVAIFDAVREAVNEQTVQRMLEHYYECFVDHHSWTGKDEVINYLTKGRQVNIFRMIDTVSYHVLYNLALLETKLTRRDHAFLVGKYGLAANWIFSLLKRTPTEILLSQLSKNNTLFNTVIDMKLYHTAKAGIKTFDGKMINGKYMYIEKIAAPGYIATLEEFFPMQMDGKTDLDCILENDFLVTQGVLMEGLQYKHVRNSVVALVHELPPVKVDKQSLRETIQLADEGVMERYYHPRQAFPDVYHAFVIAYPYHGLWARIADLVNTWNPFFLRRQLTAIEQEHDSLRMEFDTVVDGLKKQREALKEAHEQLDQEAKKRQTLVASLSLARMSSAALHELRQPGAMMALGIQQIKDDIAYVTIQQEKSSLGEKTRKEIDRIIQHAQRLSGKDTAERIDTCLHNAEEYISKLSGKAKMVIQDRYDLESYLRDLINFGVTSDDGITAALTIYDQYGEDVYNLLTKRARINLNIDIIQESMKRFTEITSVLQKVSSAAKKGKERQTYNLNDIVDDAVSMIGSVMSQSDVTKKLYETRMDVQIDYFLLFVITNLLTNAKEANDNTKKTEVSIETGKTIYQEREYYFISVKDNGSGVKEEIRTKIFEPYFTTKKEGSGIGLDIVKTYIEEQKGKVLLETDTNQGTSYAKFTVLLPIK